MSVSAPNPLIVPPVAQVTYDKIWLSSMAVTAVDPNGSVTLVATLQYYRMLDDGVTKELSPSAPINVRIPDIYAFLGAMPALASMPDAVLSGLVAVGQAQGLL